jgi:allophanate hydrolase
MNAVITPIDFSPLSSVAELLYEGPWVAERLTVVGELLSSNPEAIDNVVRGVIENAYRFSAVDAFDARHKLSDLATGDVAQLWAGIDLLMVPTSPCHPTVEQVVADPVIRNAELGSYTNFVNLLGLSALAMPAALVDHGLPFGITWIAPPGYDAALVSLGAEWQTRCVPGLPFGAPSAEIVCSNVDVARLEESLAPSSEPVIKLAVVGAHLTGMPLHSQMTDRRARLLQTTTTSSVYRLFALNGPVPQKPGLARVSDRGQAIEVEVYAVPASEIGSLLALIPSPLGLGSVELRDGSAVCGFICEPYGIAAAIDISNFRGWRAYMLSMQDKPY